MEKYSPEISGLKNMQSKQGPKVFQLWHSKTLLLTKPEFEFPLSPFSTTHLYWALTSGAKILLNQFRENCPLLVSDYFLYLIMLFFFFSLNSEMISHHPGPPLARILWELSLWPLMFPLVILHPLIPPLCCLAINPHFFMLLSELSPVQNWGLILSPTLSLLSIAQIILNR